jgi:hypothetical protein
LCENDLTKSFMSLNNDSLEESRRKTTSIVAEKKDWKKVDTYT